MALSIGQRARLNRWQNHGPTEKSNAVERKRYRATKRPFHPDDYPAYRFTRSGGATAQGIPIPLSRYRRGSTSSFLLKREDGQWRRVTPNVIRRYFGEPPIRSLNEDLLASDTALPRYPIPGFTAYAADETGTVYSLYARGYARRKARQLKRPEGRAGYSLCADTGGQRYIQTAKIIQLVKQAMAE